MSSTQSEQFNGIKVFSATLIRDREVLGERATEWIRSHPSYKLVEIVTTQSSDQAFHCIALTVFYFDPATDTRARR
jgi:hypothetical protein